MFEELVGNTPLLEVCYSYKGKVKSLWIKMEAYNFTGSIKDRMALHIIKKAKSSGELKEGMPIIEATSGNAGISFAGVGKAFGHKVIIFMPDWMSQERASTIEAFGAEMAFVSREEGGFPESIKRATELAGEIDGFRPYQFSNPDNVEAHYLTTGKEIETFFSSIGKTPTAFVAGVGTGGTVMGVGRRLKEVDPKVKIHPLEPSNSPTLSTGHKVGKHRIQGISDDFIPQIIDFKELDSTISADDGDSIIMAQKLSHDLGIGVGISSGANFIGAVKLQEQYGDDSNIVTVFADDNKKYFTTDLYREEPVKEGFLSPEIELLEFKSYR